MLAEGLGSQLPRIVDRMAVSPWSAMVHGDPRVDNFFNKKRQVRWQVRWRQQQEQEKGSNSNTAIGLLDWQLMQQSFCGLDLSWVFFTTLDLDTLEQMEHGNALIRLHYDDLVAAGKVTEEAGTMQHPACLPGGADGDSDAGADAGARAAEAAGAPATVLPLCAFLDELALSHIYTLGKIIVEAGGLDQNDANTAEAMCVCVRSCSQAMQAHETALAYEKFKRGELFSQQQNCPQTQQTSGSMQMRRGASVPMVTREEAIGAQEAGGVRGCREQEQRANGEMAGPV